MPTRLRQALLAERMVIRPPGRARHVHGANEFMFVVKGSGDHRTHLGSRRFRAGDFHFFARGQSHEHSAARGEAIVQSIRFRGDALLSESEVDRQARARLEFLRRRAFVGHNRLDLKTPTRRMLRELFRRAVEEDATRPRGYRCLLKGIAFEMIVLVARDLDFRYDDRRGTGSRILDCLEAIEDDPTRPLGVRDMAETACLSRSQFHAAFKKIVGTTFVDYLTRARVNVAMRQLETSTKPIMDVCFDSGFESASRFYDAFRSYAGMAPGEYRRRRSSV